MTISRGAGGARLRRVPIWFPLAFVGAGLLSIVIGVVGVRTELRLGEEGVTALATVQALDETVREDSHTYEATYVFVTGTGERVVGRAEIAASLYRSLRVGDRLQVVYLPSEPGVSRPGARAPALFGPGMAITIGFGAVAIGGWLWWIVRRERRPVLTGMGALALLPPPGSDGVRRFGRSRERVVAETAAWALVAVVVAGVAATLVATGEAGPVMPVVLAAMILAVVVQAVATARRGLGPAPLEVRSDGLATPASGFLPWSAIREVRVEDISLSREGVRSAELLRLGIVPVDPVPESRRGLDLPVRGVYRALAWVGRASTVFGEGGLVDLPDSGDLAPYGALEHELGTPLPAILELIRPRLALEGGGVVEREAPDGPAPIAR